MGGRSAAAEAAPSVGVQQAQKEVTVQTVAAQRAETEIGGAVATGAVAGVVGGPLGIAAGAAVGIVIGVGTWFIGKVFDWFSGSDREMAQVQIA